MLHLRWPQASAAAVVALGVGGSLGRGWLQPVVVGAGAIGGKAVETAGNQAGELDLEGLDRRAPGGGALDPAASRGRIRTVLSPRMSPSSSAGPLSSGAFYQRWLGPVLARDDGLDAEQLSRTALTALGQASLRCRWPGVSTGLDGVAADLARRVLCLATVLVGCRLPHPCPLYTTHAVRAHDSVDLWSLG